MNKPIRHISEQEIVVLLVNQDLKGMDILYDKYAAYLYGLISEIVKRDDIAELVLQDTLLKVWNKIGSYSRKKGRFLTWMMNIARNTAIDMLRSKNYKQTLKLISLENVPPYNEQTVLEVRMEYMDVRDIVNQLDDKYKLIIQLIYFSGYTQMEVSKELNIPLGTVKSRVKKAFSKLRDILEE